MWEQYLDIEDQINTQWNVCPAVELVMQSDFAATLTRLY